MNLKWKKYDQVCHAVHLTAFCEKIAADPISDIPSSLSDNAVFYTGKPYDEDLQAYHFLYRNYSPTQARWTAADPSGFPDGPNQWLYVNNGVMNKVDALGLMITPATIVLGQSGEQSVYITCDVNYDQTAVGTISNVQLQGLTSANASLLFLNIGGSVSNPNVTLANLTYHQQPIPNTNFYTWWWSITLTGTISYTTTVGSGFEHAGGNTSSTTTVTASTSFTTPHFEL